MIIIGYATRGHNLHDMLRGQPHDHSMIHEEYSLLFDTNMRCHWNVLVLLTSFLSLESLLSHGLVDRTLDIRSTNTEASTRADQTLQGLIHYYWLGDAIPKKHRNVKFFFACGQIGDPSLKGLCTCGDTPNSCVNCYRWYDGVTMESVATYGVYMNTKNNSQVPDVVWAHSPYNADWNATATCTFIDDFSWYGIAYLRVYEWLKVSSCSVD